MPDQAYDLRRLATRCTRAQSPRRGDRPALIAVTGGKGGVGSTTVALNLAATMARTGKRTLLVDADPRGGHLALLCGIEERHTLADVLAGRRTWQEATYAGPAGIGLIAGRRVRIDVASSATAAHQLLEQLDRRSLSADLIVVDAGNAPDGIMPGICLHADAVLMVTTTDAASVVGAYAAIKALTRPSHQGGADFPLCHDPCGLAAPGDWHVRLHVLVNMAPATHVAQTAYNRLARTCRRMLGIEPRSAGHAPTARSLTKSPLHTIGLNLQVPLVDTIRRVLAADALLN
jgi:flagellar biosynthesis protein FlhG